MLGEDALRLRFPRWSLCLALWDHEFLTEEIRRIADSCSHPSFPRVGGGNRMDARG